MSRNNNSSKLTFNRVQVIGHLGKTPELKYTGEGRAWVRTSIAVYQGEDKPTMWLQVKAFAKADGTGWDDSVPVALAECAKGARVQLTGKLVYEEREHNGTTYRDWGIVLYQAPVDAPRDSSTRDEEPD